MPAAGTAMLVGAAVGAVGAVVTGGNPLKGALFGAVGGGVGSAFSGLAAGAGETAGAISGEAGQAAGSVANVGVDAAESTTHNLAQSVLEGGENAAGVAGKVAPVAGDSSIFTGAAPTTAPTPLADQTIAPPSGAAAGPGSTNSPGLLSNAMKWAQDNPKLASGVLQAGGSTIGSVGQAVGTVQLAKTKAQLDLENKEKLITFYRDFIQGGSQGGVGVTMPGSMNSKTPALLRPGGGSVYSPTGAVNA